MKTIPRSVAIIRAVVAFGSTVHGDDAALAQKAQAILKASCYRCHGQEGANEGGFSYVLDRKRLIVGLSRY